MALNRTDLPAEAVKINGTYIEDVLTGYTTIITSGREAILPELETYEVGIRSGDHIKSFRYQPRIISVEFVLHGSSLEDLRDKLEALNFILASDESDPEPKQFIFNDESDRYYLGIPMLKDDFKDYKNAATGSFEIYCADPFKYSTTQYEVQPTEDSNTTFKVVYNGTCPAYPVVETDFYASNTQGDRNGECGFVAFVNDRGKILQFGEVNEPDAVAEKVNEILTSNSWTISKQILNESFNSLTNWALNQGFTSMSTYTQVGTAKAAVLSGGSDKCFQGDSFSTGSQWHGPTVTYTLPSDGGNPATTGAKDFRFHASMRFCAASDSVTAKTQMGNFQCWMLDSEGNYICGVQVWKYSGGTVGKVRLYVSGAGVIKEWTNVDFSYYNQYFGMKKVSTDKRPCNIDITKKGGKFTFNIGGLTDTFTLDSAANKVAKKVSMYLAKWGTNPTLSYMGVYSCTMFSDSVVQTRTTETVDELTDLVDIVNTFGTNDVLVADCSDGSVRLSNASSDVQGGLHPELGALGNDWEEFTLVPGTNYITTMYSDWVNAAYKPTFKMRYRERFL